jgi:hypothetical protein
MFVPPLQVLQLFVQDWQILLTPAIPDGQGFKQLLLNKKVLLVQEMQVVAVEQRRQLFVQEEQIEFALFG